MSIFHKLQLFQEKIVVITFRSIFYLVFQNKALGGHWIIYIPKYQHFFLFSVRIGLVGIYIKGNILIKL